MKTVALLVALTSAPQLAQAGPPSAAVAPTRASADRVATDLDARLARFRRFQVPYASAKLSARERQLVGKLVEAAQSLDNVYWRQNDPEGLALYKSIEHDADPKSVALRRYLRINASRFDLLDENRPFVGSAPMPPGRGFYPKDLTRQEVEDYVRKHPDERAAIYSTTTVIKREGKRLVAVPYHVEYRELLEPASRALRDAATLSDDPAFTRFLRLRADALLSDEYYESDVAWVRLEDPKFDVVMAPYETYNDGLLGVKGSYGTAVLLRNDAESRKLAVFQKYVPEIQEALPLEKSLLPSKRGQATPVEVMDNPFRSGDATHGYQAVATNLPNDPRLQEAVGTKKIFFKDFMDARVEHVVLPIGRKLMRPDQAAKVSGEGYLADALMHELSHALGPAFSVRNGERMPISVALGPVSNETDEAKADTVGMFALQWLMDHGHLPKARAEEFYASVIAGYFRAVRFGTAEAHGRAAMMELNVLIERGAIALEQGSYVLVTERLPAAFAAIAKEVLEIEATGDRERAERWFSRYDKMPAALRAALAKAGDVPVDVDPEFAFPEPVR